MRRRAKRDIGLLLGSLVIVGVIGFSNGQLNRKSLITEKDNERNRAIALRAESGMEILSWDVIRKTKGSLRKGGRFHPDLEKYDGKEVNLVGYMVQHETFKDVKEFMLLPLPLECYFCEIPPERDVMFVELVDGDTENIYDQPVLVQGDLILNRGPDQQFFYTVDWAVLKSGVKGERLKRRPLNPDHLILKHEPQELRAPVKLDSE